jgi:hypothetical protein
MTEMVEPVLETPSCPAKSRRWTAHSNHIVMPALVAGIHDFFLRIPSRGCPAFAGHDGREAGAETALDGDLPQD